MTLGLYFHLPFCRTHCSYCAFAISTDLTLQDAYTEAMLREIEARGSPEQVDSLYFGGGTPSRMSLSNLERLLASIRGSFRIQPDAEISMEANPEDVTAGSLAAWREMGVNRLSIGVQSFQNDELVPIGRVHDALAARDAVTLAIGSGIRTNLDLILGLPEQTAASFLDTIDEAVALGVRHVSLYMLDLEEKSPLRVQVDRGRVTLPPEDTVAELYPQVIARFADGGLEQYEISNFARPGDECRHNLRYWTRGPYLGFGIAAHSFDGSRRFANTRDIRAYIARSPDAVDFSETLGDGEARRETIFLGLRQAAGLDYEDVTRLCGQEGIEWIDRGTREGWLKRSGGRVAFTASGFLLSNEYISQLF